MKLLKRLIQISILILLVGGAWALNQTPSHDRDWQPYYAKTPDAVIENGIVTLKNVRNWNHDADSVLSREWIDVEVDPEDIERVWFGYSGFSKLPLLGHTFLSFELKNGEVYTLSVEARREADESFAAFYGLFNNYELLYGWGTERDFIGVRVFLLEQPIELYELDLTPEEAGGIFLALAKRTGEIATEPTFYNTVLSNCTNELVSSINERYPDSISYNLAHNFPGFSLDYLKEAGLLSYKNRFVIPNDNPELIKTIGTTPEDFSRVLREVLNSAQ